MAKGKTENNCTKRYVCQGPALFEALLVLSGAFPGFCRGERGADFVCAKAYRAGY